MTRPTYLTFQTVAEVRTQLTASGYTHAATVVIRRVKSSTKGVRSFEVVPPGIPAGTTGYIWEATGPIDPDRPFHGQHWSSSPGYVETPDEAAIAKALNDLWVHTCGCRGVYHAVK